VIATAGLRALGTGATVCVADATRLRAARRELVRELRRVDLVASRFRADSELTALNRAAGRAVPVSAELYAAVELALRVAKMTGGLVDPTVGRPLRLAGYDRTFQAIRTRDGRRLVSLAEPAPGWRSVELDPERRTVRLPAGAELDLGATAKAAAADRAAHAAARAAGAGVLVSLGGDVSIAGPAPGGGWPVRIGDDHAAPLDAPGQVVALSAGGLATSSTAVRRWRVRGGERHHLLDPRTGESAAVVWRTASVAAATCLDANAATTAAILLGVSAPGWLAERGLAARLVGRDGSVVHVGGWPAEERAA
jgi:thiamine biosynthesis lipoprotein